MYELFLKARRATARPRRAALVFGWAALLLMSIAVAPAYAHKVNMFAFAEGDRVFVEGYFADGKRAQNSEVQVVSPAGEVLVTGTTDDEGSFSFEIPQQTDLLIRLNAGMGHQTEYTLTEAELGGVPPAPAGDSSGESPEQASDAAATAGGGGTTMDQAAIRRAVGEAMRPVMRSLSELKERRTFSDIVGGVGFIVGVLGIFFYFKARKLAGGSSSPGS